eukprot:TRINITY_DN30503_c0_g1_i1.p2 TRINITY_DN30503_c0_g1~~TRINITY_DN30503_c0_g1_i1.p2  ORF type:complete len:147 (+),score=3.34 TRINITY_DN30503_c0_g1_i1:259-699(+)
MLELIGIGLRYDGKQKSLRNEVSIKNLAIASSSRGLQVDNAFMVNIVNVQVVRCLKSPGIYFNACDIVTIDYPQVCYVLTDGIYFYCCNNVVIAGAKIISCYGYGIYSVSSQCTVKNSLIECCTKSTGVSGGPAMTIYNDVKIVNC